MKKLFIYTLLLSITTECILPVLTEITAQEIPSFTVCFDDNGCTTTTSSNENTTSNTTQTNSTPPTSLVTTNNLNTSSLQISQATTLSSQAEYDGGSNTYQVIRRNFSSKPKTNQTVSINDVIARNTTLSNSIFTVQEEANIAQSPTPISPTPPEKVITLNDTQLFAGNVQVASAGEIDSPSISESSANTSLKSVPQTTQTTEAKQIKKQITTSNSAQKTVHSTAGTIPRTNSTLPSDNPVEILRNMEVKEDISTFLTVPKAFQSTTLVAQPSVEKSIRHFTWTKLFQKIWNIVSRTLQLMVLTWLIILLYEKHHKQIAIKILGYSRRQKTISNSHNIAKETISLPPIVQFECRKIRSMIPDRPYYKLVYGSTL